ncbi:amino acid ABC transporter permease [Falsirhodobacter xinxiangensis]|uniref:amino acid ABC transporter permease n=1 Tax=Falsirhodobacter xinxiangensis TaxID=2530049 RepID=UPI0010AAFFC3|nr:amino acid ABC transporter permease [Rhodobacter xinxiangensis]
MELIDIFFNVEVMGKAFPILLRGLGNTLLLGAASIVLGGIAGVLVCLVRMYAARPLRLLATVYIDIFRAIPVLVLLILIYYALPFVGVVMGAFTAATLALSMVLAAYTAEVIRAGIEAVPKGQFEASAALGLPFVLTMRKVVLPQAIRLVIPPLASYSVAIIKDTSLASVVTMNDLLKQATDTQALFANPTPLILAAGIYIAILWPLVRFTTWIERRAKLSATR